MSAPFYSAFTAAYTALCQPLSQLSPAASQPSMDLAAVRQVLEAHLPEGQVLKRGYVARGKALSGRLDGLLLAADAPVLWEADGMVVVAPEGVQGLVRGISGAQPEADLDQLAEVASWCRAVWADLPALAFLPQREVETSTAQWLAQLQQAAQQQPARIIDALSMGTDQLISYAVEDQAWVAYRWLNDAEQSPTEPLSLATLLGPWVEESPEAEAFPPELMGYLPMEVERLGWDESPAAEVLPPTPALETSAPEETPYPAEGTVAAAQAPQDRPTPRRQVAPQPHLHTPDQEGYFPLHRAAMAGQAPKVEELLEQGATTEVKDRDGNTPLHLAVQGQALAVAQALLDFGADPNHRNYLAAAPLHLAAELEAEALVSLLLSFQAETEARNNRGKTPLHIVASNGCLTCAEHLVNQGANVDATMERDIRPLHLAAWFGEGELARYLLAHQANIDAVNADGNSALHFAAFNGQVKTIKILINHGANMQISNQAGESYLHGINEGYQGEMVALI
jgi:ankyrin repeat protein